MFLFFDTAPTDSDVSYVLFGVFILSPFSKASFFWIFFEGLPLDSMRDFFSKIITFRCSSGGKTVVTYPDEPQMMILHILKSK